MWDDSDRKGIEFTGEKVKNSFFRVPKKGEKGSVWYEKNELEYLKNKTSDMLRVEKNNKSWKEIKKLSVSSWKFLEPYAKGKKVIKTPKEFEKYYSNLVDFWVCLNSFLYEILDDKTVDKNIRKYLDEFRDKTEEYTEKMSSNLDEYIETHIKKNKEIIPFINKDEVMKIINRKVSNKEILEFKKRTKGCFMLNQKVYTLSELDKVLGKNELGLEKITEDVDEFFGDSAYKGIVEGTVKVIKGFNDLDKISKGDILVTEMTNPKYLPAIKKASAVVTNEGGTLCHAAIVAREMKKPCIIGTKVATKVLSDGTKIMVDANNGIVKILEKTERPEFPPVNWHPISKRGRNHPIFIIDTMVNALSKRYDKTIYGVDLTIHEYRQIDKKREISEKDYQSIIKSLLDWAENNPSVIEKIATTSLEYVDELNDKINEWETNKIWKKEEKWEQVIDEFFTLTSKIWAGAIGYSYIFLGELVAPKFVKEVLEINNKFTEEEVLYLLQPEETTEMTLLTKELEKLASKLKTKEISLSKVDVALTSLKEKYGHLGRYYFWGKSYDKEDLLKWVKKLA
ncbi:MAG: PEP-utilizing enzyme, partial [Candidatus Nanoarchaeia archaeon]